MLKACTVCDRPSDQARCPEHRRGNTAERGYGPEHQRLRAQLAPHVEAGEYTCARCGERILSGEPWHLDHTDDRDGYLGPSHARCNSGASVVNRA